MKGVAPIAGTKYFVNSRLGRIMDVDVGAGG